MWKVYGGREALYIDCSSLVGWMGKDRNIWNTNNLHPFTICAYIFRYTYMYLSIYLSLCLYMKYKPTGILPECDSGRGKHLFFFNPAPFIFSPHAPSPRTLCLIHFGPATSPTFHISSQHSVRINTSIFLARVLYYQSTLPRYISPPAAFHHEQNKGWCTETVGPKQLNKVAERRGEGDGVNIPFRLSFSLSHEDLHE